MITKFKNVVECKDESFSQLHLTQSFLILFIIKKSFV